ncbi:phosphonate ABC transporter substrate-binding protein [Candidatus Magnetomorum sp. HK-1]|nr:phosphonate ABC transporter substrate-binding protein [Candidatus Magnetomorum sp. HK-1]
MKIARIFLSLITLTLIIFVNTYAFASQFKFGIMQDKKGAAAKYRPLLTYLKKKNIKASFISAKSYPDAAIMFANKKIDGMFSGSGIAGCMLVKELAIPIVRPVNKNGWSTYWEVVLAQKGTPKFTQNANYFKNKSVIFCSLASSGEFFFRSFKGSANICKKIMKAPSHFVAIDTLSRGIADIAIVKNRVWDNEKSKYPNIIKVGKDPGENPNGTLIVSNKTDPKLIEKMTNIFLGLKNDNSPEAIAVKNKLNIEAYIKTTIDDFKFTIPLIKNSGVDKNFNFSF